MLKALRSYWAFANNVYKLVMLGLIPILLVGINIYVYQNDIGSGLECFIALYAVDTFSDIFFMGGFYNKHNGAMEFLQSSPRFRRTIREVTIVDALRRVVLYQIPYVTLGVCSRGDAEAMEWLLVMYALPWLEVFAAQLTVLAARHFLVWNHAYACTVTGYLLMMFLILPAVGLAAEGMEVEVSVVFVVLALVAIIGTIWYTDKKMKESYYD